MKRRSLLLVASVQTLVVAITFLHHGVSTNVLRAQDSQPETLAIVVWLLTAPPGVHVKLDEAPRLCSPIMPVDQAMALARNGPQVNTSWPVVVTDKMDGYAALTQSCQPEPWGLKPLPAPQ
jgi:hypothetical protein